MSIDKRFRVFVEGFGCMASGNKEYQIRPVFEQYKRMSRKYGTLITGKNISLYDNGQEKESFKPTRIEA